MDSACFRACLTALHTPQSSCSSKWAGRCVYSILCSYSSVNTFSARALPSSSKVAIPKIQQARVGSPLGESARKGRTAKASRLAAQCCCRRESRRQCARLMASNYYSSQGDRTSSQSSLQALNFATNCASRSEKSIQFSHCTLTLCQSEAACSIISRRQSSSYSPRLRLFCSRSRHSRNSCASLDRSSSWCLSLKHQLQRGCLAVSAVLQFQIDEKGLAQASLISSFSLRQSFARERVDRCYPKQVKRVGSESKTSASQFWPSCTLSSDSSRSSSSSISLVAALNQAHTEGYLASRSFISCEPRGCLDTRLQLTISCMKTSQYLLQLSRTDLNRVFRSRSSSCCFLLASMSWRYCLRSKLLAMSRLYCGDSDSFLLESATPSLSAFLRSYWSSASPLVGGGAALFLTVTMQVLSWQQVQLRRFLPGSTIVRELSSSKTMALDFCRLMRWLSSASLSRNLSCSQLIQISSSVAELQLESRRPLQVFIQLSEESDCIGHTIRLQHYAFLVDKQPNMRFLILLLRKFYYVLHVSPAYPAVRLDFQFHTRPHELQTPVRSLCIVLVVVDQLTQMHVVLHQRRIVALPPGQLTSPAFLQFLYHLLAALVNGQPLNG